ncbi:MAG TPA: CpsD/CapB family tyrosine-protein kinase [Syntrophorhabdales bacterium]|nr:CpsD/CapB family tyrosine-protein kinase [Syntrophorhabdales bacterium]
MGRTFEALVRAEKDSKLRREELAPFEPKVNLQPYAPFRLSVSQQASEEYQGLKHSLRSLLPEPKGKVLMFVSSTHGEGTSTVVATFGTVLASSGESVMLVDANLRKPSLHDMFSIERAGGVTELLLGATEVKDVMKKTRFSNLFIITGGVPPSNLSLALSSKSVCHMIGRLKREAGWILLDAPPVNEFTDALTLCSEIDGTVLVVQAEKTKWEVALRAKQRLDDAKTNVFGVVLNRRKLHIPERIYKLL